MIVLRKTDLLGELMPAQRERAPGLDAYVGTLRIDGAVHLHRSMAEATSLHETSFFRERETFDLLRDTILPRLIANNAAQRRLRIWSAAASTGQEAYSVAMLLREHFAELADWDVRIIGTDLSREAIEYARRGCYRRLEVNRGLPARMLVKHLAREGDEWQIDPGLRSMCEFTQADLCAPVPELPRFDLVLLRNVLLQLPQREVGGVFTRVYGQMNPNGVLILGSAEQAEDWTGLFHTQPGGRCWYYRPRTDA